MQSSLLVAWLHVERYSRFYDLYNFDTHSSCECLFAVDRVLVYQVPGRRNRTWMTCPFMLMYGARCKTLDGMKKKAKPSGLLTPNRLILSQSLEVYDKANYITPVRENLQASVIQNFAAASVYHHETTGKPATPSTQLFQLSCAHLGSVGDTAIFPRVPTLLEVAKQYLEAPVPTAGRCLFPKFPHSTNEHSRELRNISSPFGPVVPNNGKKDNDVCEVNRVPPQSLKGLSPPPSSTIDAVFGGEVPIFATKRRYKSRWDHIVVDSYDSFHQALCHAPGLGPNAQVQRTQTSNTTVNSFRVYHFWCRMATDCLFGARLFYPIENTVLDDDKPAHCDVDTVR
jgi:hypothetical protein